MKKILNDLLNNRELTSCADGTYWMNWMSYNIKYKEYKIDSILAYLLVVSNFVVEDSGNFETGETHYIININDYSMTKIDKINSLINIIANNTLRKDEDVLNIINNLYSILHNESRKVKIKKIEEI